MHTAMIQCRFLLVLVLLIFFIREPFYSNNFAGSLTAAYGAAIFHTHQGAVSLYDISA